jgi:archaemetzincin
MSKLNLVCFHFQECHLLSQITSSLAEILAIPINLGKADPDLEKYRQAERGQYDAGGIISEFEKNNPNIRSVLITSVDLYIPIFTFVFGLAKLKGSTGIVSTHRLKSEFYGLPPDEDLLKSRLIKEVIHELGHLLNLRHCNNFNCVMASSNTADELDIKSTGYCISCLNRLNQR